MVKLERLTGLEPVLRRWQRRKLTRELQPRFIPLTMSISAPITNAIGTGTEDRTPVRRPTTVRSTD